MVVNIIRGKTGASPSPPQPLATSFRVLDKPGFGYEASRPISPRYTTTSLLVAASSVFFPVDVA